MVSVLFGFRWVHRTLRVTQAMAAEPSKKVREVEDLLKLID